MGNVPNRLVIVPRQKLKECFKDAIQKTGLKNFKHTSLFLSNEAAANKLEKAA